MQLEPFAWLALWDIAEAAEVVARCGAANAGVLVDNWHLQRRGGSAATLDAVPVELVLGLQLSDAARPTASLRALAPDSQNRLFPGDPAGALRPGGAGRTAAPGLVGPIGGDRGVRGRAHRSAQARPPRRRLLPCCSGGGEPWEDHRWLRTRDRGMDRRAEAWADPRKDDGAFTESLGRSGIEALAPRPGERLLDVGCGPGATTLALANLVGSAGEAVGLDIAPAMVAAAERRAGDAGVPNARFLVHDLGEGPCPRDSTASTAASVSCSSRSPRPRSQPRGLAPCGWPLRRGRVGLAR